MSIAYGDPPEYTCASKGVTVFIGLFTGLAVFSLAVIAFDFILGFSHHGAGSSHGDAHSGGDSIGHDGGHDGHAIGHAGHGDQGVAQDGIQGFGHGGGTGHDSTSRASDESREVDAGTGQSTPALAMQKRERNRSIIPAVLIAARGLVYFCGGFGPTGLVAKLAGLDDPSSIGWAVAVGAASLVGFNALRRIQTRELDSQVSDAELLYDEATVIVRVDRDMLGKVRMEGLGGGVERYVRAAAGVEIPVGARVRVVEVLEDCLIVEPAAGVDAPIDEETRKGGN